MLQTQKARLTWMLALAAITLIVHVKVVTYPFVRYDDYSYVVDNPHVTTGLTPGNIRWAFTTLHFSNWHPLTWLSLMSDAALWGDGPRGFHVTNLILHLLTVISLFAMLEASSDLRIANVAVSLLFSIHPMHVESVSWISERKGLLSTLAWILAMLAYVRFTRSRSSITYVVCMFCLVAGLLAKQMPVTLPFALMLWDFWPLGRFDSREKIWQCIREKLPLFAVCLGFCAVAYLAQSQGGALGSLESASLSDRFANAVVSYCKYLRKAFWPNDLAAIYPHDASKITPAIVFGSSMLLVAITAFAIALRRKLPFLLVGWLWYLGTLLPVIGLVQVGSHAMADRYSDIPLLGIYLAVVFSLATLVRKLSVPPQIVAVASVIVYFTLAICAYRQSQTWSDSEALFANAIKTQPDNYLAMNNLALLYEKSGDLERAVELLENAVRIRPSFLPARQNLGKLLTTLRRFPEAEPILRSLAQEHPDDFGARINLGRLHLLMGNAPFAETEFRAALALDPDSSIATANLGAALAQSEKFDEAKAILLHAIELERTNFDAYMNLAQIYKLQANPAEAITNLRRALEIRPNDERAQELLRKWARGMDAPR